ncbi:tryptophan halogenase family protein [Kordiimonas lacus]|uniref:Tryptophan halogenase n=1 Tax=Kordiimonas lacus TaxID=637679 RepID=A0A1G6SVJ4_9PROT|nr:tryptophan halogenase family protein [Kordiimonas lacus]SDD20970.1 tryptophan halogenase [Kordiimonas lacus]
MTDMRARPRVVIAGGGTAGWVTAAALSSQLKGLLDITLVESDQIGTVGVGEATIPTHRSFHVLIGANEVDFMRATRATFKLGIQFENWGAQGDSYIHSFGQIGKSPWMADFHHLWMQAKADGFGGDLGDYCLELRAAEAGKFALSDKLNLNYAYHLDASLYAAFLRAHSEARGVTRVEGKFVDVRQDGESGFIKSIVMENGDEVEGDFFIDCTGFRAALIEKVLGVGYDDWSHWLPMNRAVAVQTQSAGDILPYTRSIAHEAGWQWRIPLQHRVGNGHVYCSDYISDDEARATLERNLDGEMLFEPRVIKFLTGRRKKLWEKNCVALGLSSGFLEPLESTSIHLFQIAATRLIQYFPFNGCNPALADHFNRLASEEFESIRDFIIAHYHVTQRDDTAFWRDRQAMDIPDTLKQRLALYRDNGLVYKGEEDLFRIDSWIQVLLGQRFETSAYHPAGRLMTTDKLRSSLANYADGVRRTVAQMPSHADFIARYCAMAGE